MMKFLEVKEWQSQKKILHGFGTRNSNDDKNPRLNWRAQKVVCGGKDLPLISLRQVHGDQIVLFQGGAESACDPREREGDALLISSPGIAIGVFTADCLPILLFEPERRVAGAVHAGWRGTAKGIVRKIVKRMAEVSGCSAERIQVALGPCIGPCCYEVDGPVEAAFRHAGLPWESFASARGPGKWSLDLQAANTCFLTECGVKGENIRRLACCTACRSDLFFSYRREKGVRGSHLNFISLL